MISLKNRTEYLIRVNKSDIIISELFYVLTGAILVFGFLEFFRPKIIFAYLNLGYLVILWLVAGLSLLLIKKK